ncbi:hypothetical protein LIP_2389 [Limnochorda pilosa]|uniref:Uncharacterized protein n=1 Tax=Limnochorda pilosa TaxID=1555112 RepID=A0A0K2SMA0_LIMPI|nr:hypothetical protein LIP_2389 [Limnochorda pilosa]
MRQEDIHELMIGSIDIHAHGGSEPFERLMLEDELAIDCTRAGMRAVVIKTWYTPSASRNALVQRAVDRWAEEHEMTPVKVFGGVTLNRSVGGLNPEAVKRCLGFPGMKYVWLPMVDSYHHRRVVYDDLSGDGLRIVDEHYRVLPELEEILRICADNDLILASGHYPYEETKAVMEEAKRLGVRRLEVIHPAHIHSKHSLDQMKEVAREGVKLMLSGLGALAFPLHESGPVYAARIVQEVGADNLVYGSDFGQIHNPPHVAANRWMIQMLLAYGVSKEDVRKVFQTTPARHLGLEA